MVLNAYIQFEEHATICNDLEYGSAAPASVLLAARGESARIAIHIHQV